MAVRTRPNRLDVAAGHVRELQEELDVATAELQREIIRAGWRPFHQHTDAEGRSSVTYMLTDSAAVDRFTCQPTGGERVRTLHDFIRGGA